MRAWVALLLIAPLLAGCLAGDGTLSARDGLSDATKAARQWVDDPQLVGIVSIEPFKELIQDDFEIYVHLDDEPGDGKAPGWVYLYQGDVGGQQRTVFIALAQGLGVLAEGWQAQTGDSNFPITVEALEGWTLDSVDVADILNGHEDWPAPADNATYTWELRMWEEEGPVWTVTRSDPNTYHEAFIHATNGTVMAIESGARFEICTFGESWGGYDITPLGGGSFQHSLDRAGSLVGTVALSPTLGSISVTLTGPDGVLLSESYASSETLSLEYQDLSPGQYLIEFGPGELASLGSVDYQVFVSSCQ